MTSESKYIAILILAAGGSSRMGQPKQLLPFGEGTLLTHAIHVATGIPNANVYVVLGSESATIRQKIKQEKAQIIVNSDWKKGIGTSISEGVNQLASNHSGVLILLADQPMVDASHLKKLIQAFSEQPDRIIATAYPNNNGVPALFGKKYFQDLKELKGDQGAQKLLRQYDPIVIEPDEYFDDIDTPEAYQKYAGK